MVDPCPDRDNGRMCRHEPECTTDLHGFPPWSIEVMRSQRLQADGLKALTDAFNENRTEVKVQLDALTEKDRILEELARNSNRPPSKHDMAAEKRIADESAQRKEAERVMQERVAKIETETGQQTKTLVAIESHMGKIVSFGGKLASNPILRLVLTVAGTASAAYLASHR